MEVSKRGTYSVGILIVSDTVSRKEKEDRSGINLEKILREEKVFCVSNVVSDSVSDERNEIEKILKRWCDDKKIDLIFTVGGTGFSSRDVTPEATKAVIEKDAPHLASYMIIKCCEKTKFAVLSRSVCGIRGSSLILNLPGSVKGSQECFEVIAPVLPHALDQLKDNAEQITVDHVKIQGSSDHRISTK